MAASKGGSLLVKLLSTAGTGFFYVKVRSADTTRQWSGSSLGCTPRPTCGWSRVVCKATSNSLSLASLPRPPTWGARRVLSPCSGDTTLRG